MTRLTIETAAARGELREFLADEQKKLSRGAQRAVKQTADSLKKRARQTVDAAGFRGRGRSKPSNAIRQQDYPDDNAAIVFSKFGRREGGQFIDYLAIHTTGATLRPRRSRWLFIQLPGAGRRKVRFSPALDKRVAFVPVRGGQRILVVRRTRRRTVLLGVLLKRVRITRKLDFNRVTASELNALPQRLLQEIDSA